MTTARTKAATTSASFGTRILTQCIPGLVSGGCAESKRDARECGLKTRGLRSTLDWRPVSFTSAGKDLRTNSLAYIASESAFCTSARPPYNARRQHGSCVLRSVHSCLPGARGQRPAAGGSCCLCVRQSNQASRVPFSCEVMSLSATRSHFRFQHQMQSARKSRSPRMPPPDRAVISTRRQSDTSASPSRTNEISTSFRPRFTAEALASARFSCLARSCASTSIACRVPADRVDHPTLYEVLRIPASASPSELRVAFKLRDLELRTAGVRHSERVALERAFNIVGQPELRACYDALLADPEAPAVFPYGGFGSLLVAGEPSRDGKTFFARRILAFSPDLRRRRFHVPLRRCDFYDDRALCRDVRRKLEFWLDPAALHTLWDRTWNQWKHLLGTKIEVEGTFVQSGKYRKRRERVGARYLGNCVAEPVGGQTATRFPAANGICQNYLSSLRPVFAGSGSDPAVPGASGGRESGAAANVFRAAYSR